MPVAEQYCSRHPFFPQPQSLRADHSDMPQFPCKAIMTINQLPVNYDTASNPVPRVMKMKSFIPFAPPNSISPVLQPSRHW